MAKRQDDLLSRLYRVYLRGAVSILRLQASYR